MMSRKEALVRLVAGAAVSELHEDRHPSVVVRWASGVLAEIEKVCPEPLDVEFMDAYAARQVKNAVAAERERSAQVAERMFSGPAPDEGNPNHSDDNRAANERRDAALEIAAEIRGGGA